MSAIRHRAIACLLALVVFAGLSACGSSSSTKAGEENNGAYVTLDGVNYQLQVSRELNPFATEDHGYLVGLPAGAQTSSSQLWYGVFLWARNTSGQPRQVADTFSITDTQNNVYHPVALDPAVNPFVWTAQTLPPLGTDPPPNSTAAFGPTQGGLLLFRLNTSVYSNRPLTLQINAPGTTQTATISLDL